MKGFEWKGRECVVDITKKKKPLESQKEKASVAKGHGQTTIAAAV